MTRRFAQPCFEHEYITSGCSDCGWFAEVDDAMCEIGGYTAIAAGTRSAQSEGCQSGAAKTAHRPTGDA